MKKFIFLLMALMDFNWQAAFAAINNLTMNVGNEKE